MSDKIGEQHDANLRRLDEIFDELTRQRDAALAKEAAAVAVLRDLLEQKGVRAYRERLVGEIARLTPTWRTGVDTLATALAWLDEATGGALK